MVDGLATALLAASLGLALWAAVCAALDRLPPRALLLSLFGLQALVLVQAAVVLARTADWDGPTAELLGYLAVSAVLVPGGLVLAVEERTRWGTLVLSAACLTLAVVVVRLGAVWAEGV